MPGWWPVGFVISFAFTAQKSCKRQVKCVMNCILTFYLYAHFYFYLVESKTNTVEGNEDNLFP